MKKAAQGKEKRPAATITVEWGDDNHSITLTPKNWAAVKSGASLSLRGKGYGYEGEFFWDYWHFAGGVAGDLEVGYGSDGGQGFVGTLDDAEIEEHEYTPTPRPPPRTEARRLGCVDKIPAAPKLHRRTLEHGTCA